MDVYLTAEQLQLRAEVRAYLDEVWPPERVATMERDEIYPDDFYRDCARNGWTAIAVPTAFGGRGGNVVDLCVLVEELGKTSISLATLYITGTIFGSHALEICGSDAQRSRYLPAVVSGDARFALAMSEPGAGSDFAAMASRATRTSGGAWRIDGVKGPICGAERAEVIICAARSSADAGSRRRGISLFLLDADTPGVRFERRRFPAMRGLMVDDVILDGVEVDDDAMLGAEGEGWMNLARLMDPERLANAAQAVGVAQAAVDLAVAYAKRREQYGQPIGRFQAVSHPLAESHAEIAAARLLVYAAAHKRDLEGPCPVEASMAKTFANNVAMRAAERALQTGGAAGYESESPFMRRFLEARGCELGGGTSQIQRNIIAHHLGLR
ncbi:MAG: acyl-CoA/acyl-ACP dehydrogenase [Microthrixaceae bacterium]|nr:acyl-CoA/acyl-ACP dehydrogenase [Microthrixaceae bacterium]